MTNLSRREAIGGIAVVAGVNLISGTTSAANVTDELQQTAGTIASIHVDNGSLKFRVAGHHFYTDKDDLLNHALISAFSNGLRVRVTSTTRGLQEFFDGTGKKAGEIRKVTSVLINK